LERGSLTDGERAAAFYAEDAAAPLPEAALLFE
jgi:hypothetical protein